MVFGRIFLQQIPLDQKFHKIFQISCKIAFNVATCKAFKFGLITFYEFSNMLALRQTACGVIKTVKSTFLYISVFFLFFHFCLLVDWKQWRKLEPFNGCLLKVSTRILFYPEITQLLIWIFLDKKVRLNFRKEILFWVFLDRSVWKVKQVIIASWV